MKKLILLVVVGLILLVGCIDDSKGKAEPVNLGVEYVMFYIDDMPCV